jgi:hypothetical protein
VLGRLLLTHAAIASREALEKCTVHCCCAAVFFYYFGNEQNEGGYLEKTDDDIDCCAARVGNNGHVSQRANPSAGSGEFPRADSEGDPDCEAGGMPGTGSALRSGMDLDLRSLWLRVPPLLLSSARDSNADRTRGRLRAAFRHLKARCLFLALSGHSAIAV